MKAIRNGGREEGEKVKKERETKDTSGTNREEKLTFRSFHILPVLCPFIPTTFHFSPWDINYGNINESSRN